MFSDMLHRGSLTEDDARRLCEGMTFSEIGTEDGYAALLRANGMRVVRQVDLTQAWTRILVERHAMYRSLESDTVARLGREHFERKDRTYGRFVGLYTGGVLAGAGLRPDACEALVRLDPCQTSVRAGPLSS